MWLLLQLIFIFFSPLLFALFAYILWIVISVWVDILFKIGEVLFTKLHYLYLKIKCTTRHCPFYNGEKCCRYEFLSYLHHLPIGYSATENEYSEVCKDGKK